MISKILRITRHKKDLDVEILRSGIKQQFRNKRQSPQINDGIARSLHSREQDRLILNAGKYEIRLKDKSLNFDSSDKFRVILKSDKGHDSITFLDAEKTGEIMIPADHKLLLLLVIPHPYRVADPL